MPDSIDRIRGSLLGLALADAMGAPYEGGIVERTVWKLLKVTRPGRLRYTDDTDMTIGAVESLLACEGFDVEHMAKTWADRADAMRGYGPGAMHTLKLIARGIPWHEANRASFSDGSYGNGAAMRVAPLALLFRDDPERLDRIVAEASQVTHAHRLGIDGARIIARAVACAFEDASPAQLLQFDRYDDLDLEFTQRLQAARRLLDDAPDQVPVVEELGHGIAATESVVTALLIAAWFYDRDFDQLVGFCVSVGGDVDTIAAMAACIWGAHRGVNDLPAELERLEDREEIDKLAGRLAAIAL